MSRVLLFLIVRYFTKPVRDLMLGTAMIAKGDLSHRVKVDSADELGQLAWAFNKMVEELQKRDARILEFSPGAERIFGYRANKRL